MHRSSLPLRVLTLLLLQSSIFVCVNSNRLHFDSIEEDYNEMIPEEQPIFNPGDKLNTQLKSLLDLNNGELRSILTGSSVPELADKISPSTALLLSILNQKFKSVRDATDSMISETSHFLPGDLKIAKRRKNRNRSDEIPDSFLLTMAELSDYLSQQQKTEKDRSEIFLRPSHEPLLDDRSKRSHNKHKQRKSQSKKNLSKEVTYKYHNFHPEYFYRPEGKKYTK